LAARRKQGKEGVLAEKMVLGNSNHCEEGCKDKFGKFWGGVHGACTAAQARAFGESEWGQVRRGAGEEGGI
jgi:hypothetical protein